MRELVWMHRGRQLDNWDHTAAINFYVVNLQRGKDDPTQPFESFHPYRTKPKREAEAPPDVETARLIWEALVRSGGRDKGKGE